VRELQKTIRLIEEHLKIFDLHIDHSKTQYVISNPDFPDTADIKWNAGGLCWDSAPVLKRMKWLGF
jgi:hypothetical protein